MSGTIITDTIGLRKVMLYKALDLEIRTGMKMTAKANPFKIIKAEFNLKGSKEKVRDALKAILIEQGYKL